MSGGDFPQRTINPTDRICERTTAVRCVRKRVCSLQTQRGVSRFTQAGKRVERVYMCVHARVLPADSSVRACGGGKYGMVVLVGGRSKAGECRACSRTRQTRTHIVRYIFYLDAMILVECHDSLPRSQLKRCQALMSFVADASSYGGDKTGGAAPAESERTWSHRLHAKLSAERTGAVLQ